MSQPGPEIKTDVVVDRVRTKLTLSLLLLFWVKCPNTTSNLFYHFTTRVPDVFRLRVIITVDGKKVVIVVDEVYFS